MQASYGHREAGCVFCALEGSGRGLLENAFEALHRRRLPGERGPQAGDPESARDRRAGAAPAGVERRGGATEAAAGAAQCPGRVDQWLECGAELRRGGGADGVSCTLASDSEARRGLRAAAGWGAGGDCGASDLLRFAL